MTIATFLMTLLVAAAVAVGWQQFEAVERIVFVALVGLALSMCWRAWDAWRLAPAESERRTDAYVEDVGFTLIAYVGAFVIILAITTGWPWWAGVAVGLAAEAAGRAAPSRYKSQLNLARH